MKAGLLDGKKPMSAEKIPAWWKSGFYVKQALREYQTTHKFDKNIFTLYFLRSSFIQLYGIQVEL